MSRLESSEGTSHLDEADYFVSEPGTSVPPSVPDDPIELQQQFLSGLKQLIADRTAAEARIQSQFATSIESTERIAQRARETLATWVASEQRSVTDDLNHARRNAQAVHDRLTATIERTFTEVQSKAVREFDTAAAIAKRTLEEDLWEADAFYNAHKNDAPKQLQEFQAQVEQWLARLRQEHAQAQALVHAWRQTVSPPVEQTVPPQDCDQCAERLQERITFVIDRGARLARLRLPYIAASPVWLVAYLLTALLLVAGMRMTGSSNLSVGLTAAAAVVVGAAGWVFIRRYSKQQVQRVFGPLDQAAYEAEALAKLALNDAAARAAMRQAALLERFQSARSGAQKKHDRIIDDATRRRDSTLEEPTATYSRRLMEIGQERDQKINQAQERATQRQAEIAERQQTDMVAIERRYERQAQQVRERHETEWQVLAADWRVGLQRLTAMANEIGGCDGAEAADHWRCELDELGGSWAASKGVPPAIRFGYFDVRLADLPGGISEHSRLAEMTPAGFRLPALVQFPEQPSLLLKADGAGRSAAVAAMQAMMLRLLVSLPPDKARFTIIDPVGLGDNFAAFMHLGDYNEAIVSSRIWTEPRHIEQQLVDLSEHMENVIQNYLRNEYDTIEEYNRQAGDIAEPFRFLVIANFPSNFSEAAQRRLLSIVASGPRCGVYTLIMLDRQLPQPSASYLRDLEQQSAVLAWKNGRFEWEDPRFGEFPLEVDVPPPANQLNEMLHTAGQHATRAGRVEVSFDVIAPTQREVWKASARSGVEVSLGVAGATRKQHLRLGQGTSQHVLIAGKTGSGKSTLLHALITNLSLRYSPDEVELYLVDFKQGVEFKAYATHHLPHARVVAIESDREFGISVLNRLDAELRERADRFRALSVQDLPAFRQADPSSRMPRIVLIVDEFQEFFVEDDRISQDAALLLDRLVRQGRAFGIHVILGSQTLAGAYSLARSTIGQIAVRIALQCSEADAHLILSEDNTAARLLSRPGEAIYNDANGLIEGNQRFQIVWLPDDRREDYLKQLHVFARQQTRNLPAGVVFEGNVPADPARNDALSNLIEDGHAAELPLVTTAYLGEPVAIKGPTSVTFRRQSGNNLLIVGQNEEVVLGMISAALVSLLAQQSLTSDRPAIYIFDGAAPGTREAAMLESLAHLGGERIKLVRPRETAAAVAEIATEVERRQASGDTPAPPRHVLIYGLHKFRDLRRQDDDFGFTRFGETPPANPAKQIVSILRDGPPLGVHAIVWCDNVNNLNRAWDRQTLREISLRVALQMSTNDSSTLIDTPLASRLGMHRALLGDEEHGVLEKFRPYSSPSQSWLDYVREEFGS